MPTGESCYIGETYPNVSRLGTLAMTLAKGHLSQDAESVSVK